MTAIRLFGVALLAASLATAARADVRDHTRPKVITDTAVSESQASELTLTLTEVAMRPVQTWVRTSGIVDNAGRVVAAFVQGPDAARVEVGQRVRSFPVMYRTQMRQGYVTKVEKQANGVRVEATLQDQKHYGDSNYLLEIVAEQQPLLTVPNVSIIEEGDEHIVYKQDSPGHYSPHAIQIGTQGELYTQVVNGLEAGDQVVSIGSFFIDAEHKLKAGGEGMPGMPGMSMPGMNHGGDAMPGMNHGGDQAMPGMDHSSAPAVDHSSMPGMNHSPNAATQDATSAPADGGNADGNATPENAAAPPSADHAAMPGMDHSKMNGNQAPGR